MLVYSIYLYVCNGGLRNNHTTQIIENYYVTMYTIQIITTPKTYIFASFFLQNIERAIRKKNIL
jgi:hypothetical protein